MERGQHNTAADSNYLAADPIQHRHHHRARSVLCWQHKNSASGDRRLLCRLICGFRATVRFVSSRFVHLGSQHSTLGAASSWVDELDYSEGMFCSEESIGSFAHASAYWPTGRAERAGRPTDLLTDWLTDRPGESVVPPSLTWPDGKRKGSVNKFFWSITMPIIHSAQR